MGGGTAPGGPTCGGSGLRALASGGIGDPGIGSGGGGSPPWTLKRAVAAGPQGPVGIGPVGIGPVGTGNPD